MVRQNGREGGGSLTKDRVGAVCPATRRVEHESAATRGPDRRADVHGAIDVWSDRIRVRQISPVSGLEVEELQRSGPVSKVTAGCFPLLVDAHLGEFWRLARVRVARWIS